MMRRAMSMPFVKKAATDEFQLLGNIEEMLKVVGRALAPGGSSTLQLAAAEVSRKQILRE